MRQGRYHNLLWGPHPKPTESEILVRRNKIGHLYFEKALLIFLIGHLP